MNKPGLLHFFHCAGAHFKLFILIQLGKLTSGNIPVIGSLLDLQYLVDTE